MVRAPQLASVPPGVTVGSTLASTTELSQQEHPAPEPRQPGRARMAQDSPGARVSQQQLCARRGGTHVPWPRSAAALCPASLEPLLGTLSFCTLPWHGPARRPQCHVHKLPGASPSASSQDHRLCEDTLSLPKTCDSPPSQVTGVSGSRQRAPETSLVHPGSRVAAE